MSFEQSAFIILGVPASMVALYSFYGLWVVDRAEKRAARERAGRAPAE